MTIKPEEQVGKIAVATQTFYTPKYWVAKRKTETDVLIDTASKTLYVSQQYAEDKYPKEYDDLIFISIQIINV